MNPMIAAQNRTARLVAEAKRPTYSTDTVTAKAKAEADLLRRAEDLACGEDFCHIDGRPTNHYGEHSPEQILRWARKPGLLQSIL